MIDLAARVHYKIHLDIYPKLNGVNLFSELTNMVIFWIQGKHALSVQSWNWAQFCRYGKFQAEDYSLVVTTTSFFPGGVSQFWACRIEETTESIRHDMGDGLEDVRAPRKWVTEVGFEQYDEGKATISLIVYYSDQAGFVGMLDDCPAESTPRLVYNILANEKLLCKINDNVMSIRATPVAMGEADKFAAILKDPKRGAPILLMIPRITTENDDESKEEFLVVPNELMRNVVGNALVYYAKNTAFSEELSYFLNWQYWCKPGYIRLYQPGFDLEDGGKRHRYLRVDQIERLGQRCVVSIFRRVLSQDIRYYEAKEMFRCESCNDLYRKSRINDLKAKFESAEEAVSTMQGTSEEFQELFSMSEDDNAMLRKNNARLEDELSIEKKENWKLSTTNQQLTQYQIEMRGRDDALLNSRKIDKLPSTPYDIAMFFKMLYKDSIDFSERGMKSIDACITKPDLLWDCFYAIANNLTDMYRANTPDIEKAFKNKTGWDLHRGEGSETRKDSKLMALRKDEYRGREILIEPHICKGNNDRDPNSVRVYYCFDDVTSRIIIGHVGGHIANYSSRKV